MVLHATIQDMGHPSTSSLNLLAAIAGLCVSSLSLANIFTNIEPRYALHPEHETIRLQSTPASTSPHKTTDPLHVLLSHSKLAQLRAQGVDMNLINPNNKLPNLSISLDHFNSSFNSPIDPDSIDHILYDSNNPTNNTAQFSIQRNTNLNDGNIAGNTPSLPNTNPDAIATMTQSEGSYNFYEMAYEWEAASTKQVNFTIISGITAIQANVAKRVHSGTTTDIYDATNRVVTVPTIGSAFRWNISDTFSFKGQATTQSLNTGSSLLEFNAQTDWQISDRVGLSAGYQILRSQIDLGPVTSDLNQQGLFARLQIKF